MLVFFFIRPKQRSLIYFNTIKDSNREVGRKWRDSWEKRLAFWAIGNVFVGDGIGKLLGL